MGPNGSGKSTLAQTLLAHPHCQVTNGKILLGKKNITRLSPDKIARLGILLAFQYPQTIPGVSVSNLLKIARQEGAQKKINFAIFSKHLGGHAKSLRLKKEFLDRFLNDGLSGGEKKKLELLQLLMLKPKLAIFDEIDSGLDIDALKLAAKKINELKKLGTSILLITHYNRILKYVRPDFVHIMNHGKIIKSGNQKLAEVIEQKGYRSKDQ